jgi:phage terminase small subunit
MAMTARKQQDWGELGPAMRALNSRQRAFVTFYILENPGRGAQTNAARRAGFGTARSKPIDMAHQAWRLMSDERIQAAIAEEARKLLRGSAPEAAKALLELVRNPDHKDHARGIAMVLARTDPEIVRTDMNITHVVIDPDQEALEELRALKALHTPHAKMLEVFGVNGLDRLLALEAADGARRADVAKVIEGTIEAPADGR